MGQETTLVGLVRISVTLIETWESDPTTHWLRPWRPGSRTRWKNLRNVIPILVIHDVTTERAEYQSKAYGPART